MTRPVSSSSRVWLQSVNMLQQQKLLRDASQAGQVLLVDGVWWGVLGSRPSSSPDALWPLQPGLSCGP